MRQPNILLEGAKFLCALCLLVTIILCVGILVGFAVMFPLYLSGAVALLPGHSIAWPIALAAGAFVVGSLASGLLLKLMA